MTRHNSRFFAVATAACTCLLSLALVACNAKTAANTTNAPNTQTEEGQAPAEPDVTSRDQAANNKKMRSFDVTRLQAKKARSFVTVFVSTHLRPVGSEGEPTEISQEDWVNRCMGYVDPESELGNAFKDSPESLRSPYGTKDKRIVNATKLGKSDEKNSVIVSATVESTLQSWEKSSIYQESYLVRFGDSNRVIAIEPRGIQPIS